MHAKGPCSPLIHSVVSLILLADSEGPDAQADPGLCCPYMPGHKFTSRGPYYSRTSMARTPMARLPWMSRTRS